MGSDLLRVSHVTFSRATSSEQRSGLLGYLRFEFGGLVLDGVTLRRTRDGRLTLSYPKRGRDHPVVRPLDDATRRDLERQVLAALRAQGELS